MEHPYLAKLREVYPSLSTQIAELQDLHSRRLWHQLSLKVEDILAKPEFSNDPEAQLRLYNNFIKDFELKFNLLKLASIAVGITKKYTDAVKAIEFLESIAAKVADKDKEAHVLCKIEIALWKLRQGDQKACKLQLEECKAVIDELASVDNSVHSAYYRVNAEYLKITNQPGEFYKTALLYLAYTPLDTMSVAEQRKIAFDLGIAALLGKNVYNFGELLGHPAVNSLEGTDAEWLLRLLHTFNRGDISSYEQLVATYKNQLASQPDLVHNAVFLKQKIQLMSLMELVFQREVGNRVIPFQVVSDHTKQPIELVELLLLKALALGLIRGVLNQVDQTVSVTWVQPRVLDRNQIAIIKGKIGSWIDKVHSTLVFLEKETPELFV
eukprot:GEZU01036366.1.p1 GENE.GEZU01036366.1~~GEZU01036366.1.p1  ORF type:complete len:382 (-),score=119.78 GEZU01036366.1:265-1410(-)